ncbi:AAA family ATPase [Polycladidibacter hongkongensis]|uniref:AAA family ATPase n=1 Tax=Polycladidibacter hongkongensis TaxID=1647556 RepID=UPI00082FA6EF|nr:MoxR family ATPase [Pseudovibrio hongkongensis]
MEHARTSIACIRRQMQQGIVGQEAVVESLIIGLLANGNLLIEGLPGLAKTRAVKALADTVQATFKRIQFTPDLLPSDVTGTEVYHQIEGMGQFRFEPGPIFANIVLADEINRSPAKVQSALLEAMEERQVTVAGKAHRLERLFMVMATQNPIEQEGTYALPEAQLDRFLMHVLIDYPTIEEEKQVIQLVRAEEIERADPATGPLPSNDENSQPIPQAVIFKAREEISALHVAEAIDEYVTELVYATRTPASYCKELAKQIEIGASPRASLSLDRCARTHAWLAGRDYVDPADIVAVAPNVLRHRISLSFEAQGEGTTADQIIQRILQLVAVA